jgi:hypothetical protein
MQYRSFNFLILGISVFLFFSSLVSFSIAGQLIYSTYLGGGGRDYGTAIALDGSRNTYIIGYTDSSDFPTTLGAFDTNANSYDVFLTKLDATGTVLEYSTYLGGSHYECGNGIAIDSSGNAYVIGLTDSSDFPTTSYALDTSYNGFEDVFVSKLNPNGSELIYSTYLGGGNDDRGFGIAVDTTGNAYLTGHTKSSDFPTTVSALDTSYNGDEDVFVSKLNPNGTGLVYSTFIGGNSVDNGEGLTIDTSGNVYITGYTWSSDFPITAGAWDTSWNGSADVFITKLNSNGNGLDYSTYLGGSDWDQSHSITIDSTGSTYITGYTISTNYPTTIGVLDSTFNGNFDAFVIKLNPSGTSLIYSTYLGGSNWDEGYSITVDTSGNAYLTGITSSSNFPKMIGAFDTTYNGAYDAFVCKLNSMGTMLIYSTYFGGSSYDSGRGIAVDVSNNVYITGVTESNNFPTTFGAWDTTFNSSEDVFVSKLSLKLVTTEVDSEIWMLYDLK